MSRAPRRRRHRAWPLAAVAIAMAVGGPCRRRSPPTVIASDTAPARSRVAPSAPLHPPAVAAPSLEEAEPDDTGLDRLAFLLTSCEPDPRRLSLPERRLLPPEAKESILGVLERSRLRARVAASERYAALVGSAPPERASTDWIVREVWAALAPDDRGRVAEAIGGGAAPGGSELLGLDTLVATLSGEAERAYQELQIAVGDELAARVWSDEIVSWCAFDVPL